MPELTDYTVKYSIKSSNTIPPLIVSGGGVNGSSSHFFGGDFGKCVQPERDHKVSQCPFVSCDVPIKLLMRTSCLRLRKKISMFHRALYRAAMLDSDNVKLFVSNSTSKSCSSFHTAMRRNRLGYLDLAVGSSNSIISLTSTFWACFSGKGNSSIDLYRILSLCRTTKNTLLLSQ